MAKTHRKLPSISIQEQNRFWSLVSKLPGQGPKGDCWEWQGKKMESGYGQFYIRKGENDPRPTGLPYTFNSNRIAYFLSTGEDPLGLVVLHECDNPSCCNPDHLKKGTYKENTHDALAKGRLTGGDDHWMRRSPEKIARGKDHWTHRKPECLSHSGGRKKVSDDQVREIRLAIGSHRRIAAQFGITPSQVGHIKRGKSRREVV